MCLFKILTITLSQFVKDRYCFYGMYVFSYKGKLSAVKEISILDWNHNLDIKASIKTINKKLDIFN